MKLRAYAEGVFSSITENVQVSKNFTHSFNYLDHVVVLHAGRKQRRRKIVASAWHVPAGSMLEDVINNENAIDLGIIGNITEIEAEYMVTLQMNPISVKVTATDIESAIFEAKRTLAENWVDDDFDDSTCVVSTVNS